MLPDAVGSRNICASWDMPDQAEVQNWYNSYFWPHWGSPIIKRTGPIWAFDKKESSVSYKLLLLDGCAHKHELLPEASSRPVQRWFWGNPRPRPWDIWRHCMFKGTKFRHSVAQARKLLFLLQIKYNSLDMLLFRPVPNIVLIYLDVLSFHVCDTHRWVLA